MEKLLTKQEAIERAKAMWDAFDRGYAGKSATDSDLMRRELIEAYQMGREQRKREEAA